MKKVRKFYKQMLLIVLVTAFMQCSIEDPETNINPEASSINDHISQFPDWIDPTEPMEFDSLTGTVEMENDAKIPVTCDKYRKATTITKDDIIAVGTNFGKLWPGAIIEGNSLEGGDLKLINVDRSGITINTDLPINQTFRKIEDPNSVTVQQAISEMQIESGLMPEGVQAGAGVMDTRVEEYSSFLQAMLSVGINGGFTEPETKIKLSGEAKFGIEREQNTHSVITKFVQKAFTVRLADDLIETPADFFANTVTLEDIKELENEGTMSPDNVPLYIESVTYGRFLLFSLTSTTVKNAATLQAAVEASWDQYANAGGELSAEFKLALESKTTKIFSAGGSEEGANAAVANLNWSEFFVEAPVTTAVPISFVARTLNGRKKVVLVDNAIFDQRGDCATPEKVSIKVKLKNVTLENPKLGLAEYVSSTFRNGQQVGDVLETGEFVTAKNTDKVIIAGKGAQEYTWTIAESDPDIDRMLIRSANNFVHNNQNFKYPFKEFYEGSQNRTWYVTNNRGEKMRFDYLITKSFE